MKNELIKIFSDALTRKLNRLLKCSDIEIVYYSGSDRLQIEITCYGASLWYSKTVKHITAEIQSNILSADALALTIKDEIKNKLYKSVFR